HTVTLTIAHASIGTSWANRVSLRADDRAAPYLLRVLRRRRHGAAGAGRAVGMPVRQRLRRDEGGRVPRQLRQGRPAPGRRLGPAPAPPAIPRGRGARRPRLGLEPLSGPQPGGRTGGPGRRTLVGLFRLLVADGGARAAGPRAPRHRHRERLGPL